MRKQLGRGRALDHRATVHHHHTVHLVLHQAQVVADQKQAHAIFTHQLLDEPQHLFLHRHIQRGGGLVGNQQVGTAGQRDRDHHALALPTGQLVRIGIQPLTRPRQLHAFEQLQGAGFGVAGAHVLVQAQGLGDLLPDRMQGVERRHRLLEDHGHAGTAQLAHLRLGQAHQLLLLEHDGTAHTGAFGQQAHQGQCGERFATATLTNQAHRLAPLHAPGHATQGLRPAPGRGQAHAQIIDLQQRLGA